MNVTFFEAKNHSSVKSKGCGYAGICKINRQPDAELTVMGRRLLSQQVRNEWVLLTFMDGQQRFSWSDTVEKESADLGDQLSLLKRNSN